MSADRVSWWKMVITGMQCDFSWTRSATRYSELYRQLVQGTFDERQAASPRAPGAAALAGAQESGRRLH